MKNVNDLAVFTGKPTFNEKLHVGRPNLGDRKRFLAQVEDILDRRWLTNNGPYVQRLEQEIAQLLNVKNCIVVCNATVGLEIAIRALGMKGEVIVPSLTFVATVHALQWQEITPVFCDVDPTTHNLDPRSVSQMITPHTTGIIGVHVWGRPCETEALADIARRHKLRLLYDAAHAFGCSHNGQMIGNFGDAEVFSFHATKFFNTLEGGAVVTNNDSLAAKIRLMRNFGFSGVDEVSYIGTNGKMNEISAAMGLTSLESLDKFVETNYQHYKQYRQELADIPGLTLIQYNETEQNNYQYIVLEVDEEKTQICRDDLVTLLGLENVLARRYFYPGCHRMEPYRSYYPHANLLLPETERLSQSLMSLPTGTAVSTQDIHKICHLIRLMVENGALVRKQLNQQASLSQLFMPDVEKQPLKAEKYKKVQA